MKKETIIRCAIGFSSGFFGCLTAIYSLYTFNISLWVILPMLMSCIGLVAMSLWIFEDEFKRNQDKFF